ncbi:MAG: hypothetical protein AAGB01_02835 [Cyanobacteria bacterium P01_F01_bin.42]
MTIAASRKVWNEADLKALDEGAVLDIMRTTYQCRMLPFGDVRKFQSSSIKQQGGIWFAQDPQDGQYYRFWCKQ